MSPRSASADPQVGRPDRSVLVFGQRAASAPGGPRRPSLAGTLRAARAGSLDALIVDARSSSDLFRAAELLRALYDDPQVPRCPLHPHRVLALIANGDVEAAFTLGRFGIAGVLEERSASQLGARLERVLASTPDPLAQVVPLLAPARPTHLAPRAEGEPPTVAIGYRHAAQTLDALGRYQRVLQAHAHESTVFADVAELLDVMVDEGLTCQTNLAAKAGATHSGQFIGSFEFYRQLRRTRYARIPDHPAGAIDMDVFIAVDEVLHEVLHLLFLANQVRAASAQQSTLVAEELSLTWWQAVIHSRVFPEWLLDQHILEINDDFLLSEQNARTRGFWDKGTVFSRYAGYPWVPHVLARLPERAAYVGERPDLADVVASYAARPEAAFLVSGGRERLAIPVPFDSYPSVASTLRVGSPARRA